MTEHHPTTTTTEPRHDYLPAAGRDALLPFYDLLTPVLGVPKVHRRLISQAGLAPGQRVLEIGCGTGNLSLLATRACPGVEMVGSDPDPLALARARRKAHGLNGIRFERGYAQRLPYPDATFDRVLSAFMLHHLDHGTKAATAAEVLRVLRPGASLHLVDVAGEMPGIHGLLARRVVRSGHLDGHSGGGIPQLLDAAGLHCTEAASQRHPVMGRITYYRADRPG
jgi:SAM-dependent methyltransferase